MDLDRAITELFDGGDSEILFDGEHFASEHVAGKIVQRCFDPDVAGDLKKLLVLHLALKRIGSQALPPVQQAIAVAERQYETLCAATGQLASLFGSSHTEWETRGERLVEVQKYYSGLPEAYAATGGDRRLILNLLCCLQEIEQDLRAQRAQAPPTVPALPLVAANWRDEFTRNRLSDYVSYGDPKWEKGRLHLHNAGVIKAIEPAISVKISAALTFNDDNRANAGVNTHFSFLTETLRKISVCLTRTISNGKPVDQIQLAVTDVTHNEKESSIVRSYNVEDGFDAGHWECRYDCGLLTLSRNKLPIRQIYLDLLELEPEWQQVFLGRRQSQQSPLIAAAGVEASSGAIALRQLEISRALPEEFDEAMRLGVAAQREHLRGDTLLALDLLRRQRENLIRALTAHHPFVATNDVTMAKLELAVGQLGEAEERAESALKLVRELVPGNHILRLGPLGLSALILFEKGKIDESGIRYRECLRIARSLFREDNFIMADSLSGLSRVYIRQGDLQRAEDLLIQSVEACRSSLGETSPDTLAYTQRLCDFYCRVRVNVDKLNRLTNHFLTAIERAELPINRKRDLEATAWQQLAMCHDRCGNVGEAVAGWEKVRRILETLPGREEESLRNTMKLARGLSRLGQIEAGLDLARKSLETAAAKHQESAPLLSMGHRTLGGVLFDGGHIASARRELEKSLEILGPEAIAQPNEDTIDVLFDLGLIEERAGNPQRALNYLNRCIEFRQRTLSRDDPLLTRTLAVHGRIGSQAE